MGVLLIDWKGNHGVYNTAEGLNIAYVASAGNANKNVAGCIHDCQMNPSPIDLLYTFDWPAGLDTGASTKPKDSTMISWSSSLIDLLDLIVMIFPAHYSMAKSAQSAIRNRGTILPRPGQSFTRGNPLDSHRLRNIPCVGSSRWGR